MSYVFGGIRLKEGPDHGTRVTVGSTATDHLDANPNRTLFGMRCDHAAGTQPVGVAFGQDAESPLAAVLAHTFLMLPKSMANTLFPMHVGSVGQWAWFGLGSSFCPVCPTGRVSARTGSSTNGLQFFELEAI